MKVEAIEGNPLAFLEVSFIVGKDSLGPKNSFLLRIRNPSSKTVEDVVIVLNGTYRKPLKDFLIYDDFWNGTRSLDRSKIVPGDDLAFTFSHDISNQYGMRNGRGEPLRLDIAVTRIEVRSKSGTGQWRCTQQR